MRTLTQLEDRLRRYGAADYVYDPEVGYLAWHFSTGENVEVLFIEARDPGSGQGVELYRRMVRRLQAKGQRPYHSVFGYRLLSNVRAERFYAKMGWTQQRIWGQENRDPLGRSIYGGEPAVLFWIAWDDLLASLFPPEDNP